MASRPSPPSPQTLDELSDLITAHRAWVRSGGKVGQKAELSGANLEGLDVDGFDLSQLDFRGANLARVKFGDALVEGANFGGADLQEADLSAVRGLLAPRLAGADLAGAKLPEGFKEFTALKHVDAASGHVQKIFFLLLLVCVYCWLTIAVTTDANFFGNFAEQALPIIGTRINIVMFYWAAPFLLLCVYLYFHLCLQRLWEALAELPAVFPDGLPLPRRVHPWLWNGLVWAYFPRLRDRRPPLLSLQKILAILLVWWAGPLTILALWYRYLPAHDWAITILQLVFLTLALDGAIGFSLLTLATLLRKERKPFAWKKFWPMVHGMAVVLRPATIAGIFFLLSLVAIQGLVLHKYLDLIHYNYLGETVIHLVPLEATANMIRRLDRLNYGSPLVEANLSDAEVSLKPPQWTGKPGDIDLVRGAVLRNRNLQGATANRAFLAKADLERANLQNAFSIKANLQGANLEVANLQGAFLEEANLQGAYLKIAKLQGAILVGANLQGANLQGANLQRAILQKANLHKADLKGASLQWADFRGAQGLETDQVRAASNWQLARYPSEMLKALELPPEHNQNIELRNLSGYQLPRIDFQGADLYKFNLLSVNLRGAYLERADLSEADLSRADLRDANLKGASLRDAHLEGADLRGANLEEAHMSDSYFTGADTQGAKLKGAWLFHANLKGTDLRYAEGLTRKQLRSAIMDENTKLPEDLKDLVPSGSPKP